MQALDLRGAVGVGHSMGGHALVQAAAMHPGGFARLVLIDPVIRAPEEYLQADDPAEPAHPAVGRKNHFASPEAMAERFRHRPPYSVFDPAALRDYCVHGLVPAAAGAGWQLACAPAFEGRVYPRARRYPAIHDCVRALRIPVQVVRARPQDPAILPWDPLGTPTWPALAGAFKQGRDLQLMDKTHMLPMEDPALTARLIGEALGPVNATELTAPG